MQTVPAIAPAVLDFTALFASTHFLADDCWLERLPWREDIRRE